MPHSQLISSSHYNRPLTSVSTCPTPSWSPALTITGPLPLAKAARTNMAQLTSPAYQFRSCILCFQLWRPERNVCYFENLDLGPIFHWNVIQVCFWGSCWCRVIIGSDNDLLSIIGIDHDTVCAGVIGTAIRHSTSCAGRCAAALAGTTSAVPDCNTKHDSADRISGQFLFYHDHNFTKSKGNLRFRRLVPLFVPIGVCVTTHDDGTASDVTIAGFPQLLKNH